MPIQRRVQKVGACSKADEDALWARRRVEVVVEGAEVTDLRLREVDVGVEGGDVDSGPMLSAREEDRVLTIVVGLFRDERWRNAMVLVCTEDWGEGLKVESLGYCGVERWLDGWRWWWWWASRTGLERFCRLNSECFGFVYGTGTPIDPSGFMSVSSMLLIPGLEWETTKTE